MQQHHHRCATLRSNRIEIQEIIRTSVIISINFRGRNMQCVTLSVMCMKGD